MGKSSLATLLLACAVLGCKSGKMFHLVQDSPYVDPKTGAVNVDPKTGAAKEWRDRTSWWDILFSKDEPEPERIKLNLDKLDLDYGSAPSSERK